MNLGGGGGEWEEHAAAYTNGYTRVKLKKNLKLPIKQTLRGLNISPSARFLKQVANYFTSALSVFSMECNYPYNSPRTPINAYGKTKEEGEKAIEDILISKIRVL